MAIKNTVSSDFYMGSSIVKSIFDCYISDVIFATNILHPNVQDAC